MMLFLAKAAPPDAIYSTTFMVIAGIFFLLILIPTYFLPTIIAMFRGHKNTLGIFLINLFLGFLLVGWVGALVWASLADQSKARRRRSAYQSSDDDNPFE